MGMRKTMRFPVKPMMLIEVIAAMQISKKREA